MPLTSEEDSWESSVCYWRFCQPQVDCYKETTGTTKRRLNVNGEDENTDYEVLYPREHVEKVLSSSKYYHNWIHQKTNYYGDFILQLCANKWLLLLFRVAVSIVHRFTYFRFNWETQTLRSFLEMGCWLSVSFAMYQAYHNFLWAFQIGTLVGLMMSICNEFVYQIAPLVVSRIHGLQKYGFDIKSPARAHDLALVKTMLFGCLGFSAMQSLFEHPRSLSVAAFLAAAVGVSFVMIGELFTLWIPTRRLGYSIQSRWTHFLSNWQNHFLKSLLEISAWTLCLIAIHVTMDSIAWTIKLGTVAGILISIISDALASSEAEGDDHYYSSFTSTNSFGEILYAVYSFVTH